MRAILLLLWGGCDAAYVGFLDSVPVSDEDQPPSVHVILAVDGVSRAAFDGARARGAFSAWADADLITVFPGTSDYAWTRTLRTEALPGYEIQYYDPTARRLVGRGLIGVLDHAVRQGLVDVIPCYQRFDFLGDGELWMARSYADPEAALPDTMEAMFDVLVVRSRRQATFLGYLLNVDVIGHMFDLDRSVAALVEIDRQIRGFQERHPGRFHFTMISDHGDTHRTAELVDPAEALREVGIEVVDALSEQSRLEAVPIIHVRVNYVAVHTHPDQIAAVAQRASTHRWVDLAVAPLPDDGGSARRYGVWRAGQRLEFALTTAGDVRVDDAAAWRAIGVDLGAAEGHVKLSDRDAFDRTRGGPWPDLFHRIDGAFTDPAVDLPADVILSLTDDVASFGFRLPGGADSGVRAGFHGSLSRASTLSVAATEVGDLPPALRTDDLVDVFPDLAPPASDETE